MESKVRVSADVGMLPLNTRNQVQQKFIFVDYQTDKLQYNYQSYIQVKYIEDARRFQYIALNKDFSGETLKEVRSGNTTMED